VLRLPIFSSFFFSLDILVHFDSGVESVRFTQSKFALLFVHWEVVLHLFINKTIGYGPRHNCSE